MARIAENNNPNNRIRILLELGKNVYWNLIFNSYVVMYIYLYLFILDTIHVHILYIHTNQKHMS